MSSLAENVLSGPHEHREPPTAMIGRHGATGDEGAAPSPLARPCVASPCASSSPVAGRFANPLGIELRRAANRPGSSAHRQACPALPGIPDGHAVATTPCAVCDTRDGVVRDAVHALTAWRRLEPNGAGIPTSPRRTLTQRTFAQIPSNTVPCHLLALDRVTARLAYVSHNQ